MARWFAEICQRTADMVVHWMRVGFVHGVLNTDNMSILGLTIDYGPYGWLEVFDPGWTPNTTDAGQKRYRFGAQPSVVKWNLAQLAEALVPLTDVALLEAALAAFDERYQYQFQAMMMERLGWGDLPHHGMCAEDGGLVNDLFALLTRTHTDYVLFMRQLALVPVAADVSDDDLLAPLDDAWYQPEEVMGEVRDDVVQWLRRWAIRVSSGGLSQSERMARMNAVNPRFVLRNWMAQEVIDDAEQGDVSLLHELLEVLRRPYDEQPGRERFAARRPEWARNKVGCSMLSCSS